MMQTCQNVRFHNLDEVIDDIYVRFLMSLPEVESSKFERLGFHLEQAFWFYEDFVRTQNDSSLPKYTLKTFAALILARYSKIGINFVNHSIDTLFESFKEYKSKIPTCGAIIINTDHSKCLLIRVFKGTSWGFPKGKMTKHESPEDCAIREVKILN